MGVRFHHLFLILLAGLTLLWAPGFYMNDEHAQAVGLVALHEGKYLVDGDLPEGYDGLRQTFTWHGSIPDEGDSPHAPVGSTMNNVLALPARHVLGWTSDAVGVHMALVATATALITAGLWAAQRALWPGVEKRAVAAGLAGAAALLLIGGPLTDQGMASSPFLEIASLQLVAMGFAALAGALMHDMLRRPLGDRMALAITALYVLATPALFWALNLKYHGVAMSLVVVAMWCFQDGHRTTPLRTALAFAVAGLAVWNHLPSGGLLLIVLGLLALPAVRLGWLPLAQRAGAGAAGLVVGLLPELMERTLRARLDQGERYVRLQPGDGGTAVVSEVGRQFEGGYLSRNLLAEPAEGLDAVWQSFVWTDWMDFGPALSHFSLFPLLALAPLVLADRRLRAILPTTLWVWPVLHITVLYGLTASYLFNHGAGMDVRLASSLWPSFLLLAVPAVVVTVQRRGAKWMGERALAVAITVLAVLLVTNLLVQAIAGQGVMQMGYGFEAVWLHRSLGLIAAVALLASGVAAALVRGRWRPHLQSLHDHLVAAGLALAVTVQFVIQIGPARFPSPLESGPYLLWPMEFLMRFVHWMMYLF